MKNKVSQKSFSENPFSFKLGINSPKQLTVLQNIWVKFLIFKKQKTDEKSRQNDGDLFKLTKILYDPNSLLLIPYLHKQNTFHNPMARTKLSIMKFPNMGNFQINLFFKEFRSLILQAMEKNNAITTKLIDIFLDNIWNSVIFKLNRDQDIIIDSFEKFYTKHNYEEKLSNLQTDEQLKSFFTSQNQSITEINAFITHQIDSFSPNTQKPRHSFKDIHNDIKRIFEVYGYLVGFIRGLFDIISDTFDPKIKNYMSRNFNICYGIPNNNSRKSTKWDSKFSKELYLSKTIPVIRYLIEKIVVGKLRPLQNSASPPMNKSTQENKVDLTYIIENKKQEYAQKFTLSEYWILKSNLVLFMNLCYNFFFYFCPGKQTGKNLKKYLEFCDIEVDRMKFQFP
jgi:nucleoid DNA-binding protein